jgi:2Fe-2S ferredoxin
MPRVTYIASTGESQVVEVDSGTSLMQAARDNGVAGILGDCGGGCACATCHVIVDDAWAQCVGGPGSMEADMLGGVEELQPTSRLSCQITMSEALDGVVLHLPESQL